MDLLPDYSDANSMHFVCMPDPSLPPGITANMYRQHRPPLPILGSLQSVPLYEPSNLRTKKSLNKFLLQSETVFSQHCMWATTKRNPRNNLCSWRAELTSVSLSKVHGVSGSCGVTWN
eukprot:TRINITY_DN15634_c0_g2_i1.p1 TRINITY_DN15634_c0_g2~~TRINITY_DN15634_c0_g2_i1.p1  ORF type:complete len:118 (-),score=12.67 TRINITY_DN15634_c0_g2_i1:53-406(-)